EHDTYCRSVLLQSAADSAARDTELVGGSVFRMVGNSISGQSHRKIKSESSHLSLQRFAGRKSSGGLVRPGCSDRWKSRQRSLRSRWRREGAQVIHERYAFMGADPSVYTFIRVATQTSIYRACL